MENLTFCQTARKLLVSLLVTESTTSDIVKLIKPHRFLSKPRVDTPCIVHVTTCENIAEHNGTSFAFAFIALSCHCACANDKAATKPIAAASLTHCCRIEKNYFLKMQTICNGCKLSIGAVMKVKLDQNCP